MIPYTHSLVVPYTQERMLKLHEQLLATVSGLIRRDCNYYNIDMIKTECTWDQDRAEWNLPQVTVTKTTLSPVSSHRSMQKKSASTSTLQSMSSSFGKKLLGSSPSATCTIEEVEGERRVSCQEELDYFKPKRAYELLAEGAQLRGRDSRKMEAPHFSVGTSTAASVHGLDSLLSGDAGLSWKRGRLHSLPPPSSHNHGPHSILQHGPHSAMQQQPAADVLETVERKKNKWRSLEPLGDPHKRHPPP